MKRTQPPDDFTGKWIYRYPSGARREIIYVNGSPNGPFRYVHEHGQVLREGYCKDGLYDGSLITRNVKGEVLDVSEFVSGTGTYRIFYSSGQLAQEIELQCGKRHGHTRKWDGSGQLVRIEHWCRGEFASTEDLQW
jgi:antitoxin component YwqK of YwqJK toxin-antitoxin module